MNSQGDTPSNAKNEMPALPLLPPPTRYSTASQPLPSRPPHQNGQVSSPRPKRKRRGLRVTALILIPVVLVGVGIAMFAAQSLQNPDRETLDAALDDLSSAIQTGDQVIGTAGDLDAHLQETLDADLDLAVQLHNEVYNPSVFVLDLGNRIGQVEDMLAEITPQIDTLQGSVETRDGFEDALDTADTERAEAESVLTASESSVTDEATRTTLSDQITNLDKLIGEDVDETNSEALVEQTETISVAIDFDLGPAVTAVLTSMDDYEAKQEAEKEAEEQAALKDPANYASISDRDWQLLERDAGNHTGEKYIVYGHVTQADSATGTYAIRVNTSGEQLSRSYDYNINTFVYADQEILKTVVSGDMVEMYVEVQSSTTYDTTIGGSATALVVMAYHLEVIG